jgi:hypothetical protein
MSGGSGKAAGYFPRKISGYGGRVMAKKSGAISPGVATLYRAVRAAGTE